MNGDTSIRAPDEAHVRQLLDSLEGDVGLFDSIRKFFGGSLATTAPPVEVPPPNTEPAVAPFPPNPEMEAAIAKGADAAWQGAVP